MTKSHAYFKLYEELVAELVKARDDSKYSLKKLESGDLIDHADAAFLNKELKALNNLLRLFNQEHPLKDETATMPSRRYLYSRD